ncbi:enoyl-CoA hydratase/isomerase family protein [uncultured Salinisphaera sp.]|uniref:enoyl-CoA hydratase/isomerase family protein n=1 Tax=uncultured Salinisphaera sp. TaxID=359372 RepID=UPI0032B173F7|tara:strand:+ start:1658 stop:2761 length:1104 start_codon:yes stop_codon:yes gene_type:complete
MSRIHKIEVPLNGGAVIGHLTLDNPKALNAVALDMIEPMLAAIHDWEARPEVVAIVIDAAGDKAFCAGGDIVNLYRSKIGEAPADYPERFFTQEYRLCHDLHRLTTPVIAWGHGVVMGGGCGLFAGASHRVVTETTRLAMPEIKIGLFPDCGATWFFSRLPHYMARFAALTGATLSPADTLFAGLAEHAIRHEAKDSVMAALGEASDWHDPQHTVSTILAEAEERARAAEVAESQLMAEAPTLQRAAAGSHLVDVVSGLAALTDSSNEWLAACAQNLVDGCPTTAHLIHDQLETGRYLSLAQCMQRELAMALACCRHADFAEGVRALLVDKDKQPAWTYTTIADVPAAHVADHFVAGWNGAHPLADL